MKRIILLSLVIFSLISINMFTNIIGVSDSSSDKIDYKEYVKEKKIRLEFDDCFKEIKDYAKENDSEEVNISFIDMEGNVLYQDDVKLKSTISIDLDNIATSENYSSILMRINIVVGERIFSGLYEKIYVSTNIEDEELYEAAVKLQTKKNGNIIMKEVIMSDENIDNLPTSLGSKNIALSTLPDPEELEDVFGCIFILYYGFIPANLCYLAWNRVNVYADVPIADIQSVEGVKNTFTFNLNNSVTNVMDIAIGASYEGVGFEITGSKSIEMSTSYGFSYTVEDGVSKIIGTKFQFVEQDAGMIVVDLAHSIAFAFSGVAHEIYPSAFVGGVTDMGPSYGSNYKVSYVTSIYLGSEYQTYPQDTNDVYWGNGVILKYSTGVSITFGGVTEHLSSEVATVGNYRYTADFKNYYEAFNVVVPTNFLYYVYGYTDKSGPRFTVTTNPFRLQYPSSC